MGSGFKTFTAGAVLTASEVNNYLMEQAIPVFATTAARDAAITSPEAGMVCYINSNDANEGLYHYVGAAWYKGAGWNAPWGVLTRAFTTSTTTINAAHTAETVVVTSSAVTIPANRIIKITAGCRYASGGGVLISIGRIRRGTTTGGTEILLAYVPPVPSSNAEVGAQIVGIDSGGASGSTQYVLTLAHSANTDDRNPTSIIIEDIGPSGAPA